MHGPRAVRNYESRIAGRVDRLQADGNGARLGPELVEPAPVAVILVHKVNILTLETNSMCAVKTGTLKIAILDYYSQVTVK